MKKTMKKIVSVALVVALLIIPFSTLLNVKALNIETNDAGVVSNTVSSLTVTNVGKGDQLGAYKILDALYNKTSNVISYQFTQLFKDFQASEDGKDFASLTVDEYSKFGEENLSAENKAKFESLYTEFAKYIKKTAGITADQTLTAAADAEAAVANNVVVGSYLILPISTSGIYEPMIVNVEIKANNGAWELTDPASVQAKYTAISDVFPSGADQEGGTGKAKSIISKDFGTASVVQGEQYIYIVSTPLPTYPVNASNTVFTIVETLDKGIEFKGFDKMTVSDGVYGEDGTITVAGTADGQFVKDGKTYATATSNANEDGTTTITIVFTYSSFASKNVEVRYAAALAMDTETDKIVFGNPYKSKSVLTYSVDPYGTATKTTSASIAYALTYGLKINNIKKDDNNTKLVGAKFALYKLDTEGNKTGNAIATAEYKDGTILFDRGIAATTPGATYRLVQTTAPAGYTVAAERNITLDITAKDETFADGSAYYVEADKTFIATVANSAAGLLPATGGLGTVLYTLIGLFIITFSATAVVYYRKKKTTTNE